MKMNLTNCPHCNEQLPAVRDAFCSYCHQSLIEDTDDELLLENHVGGEGASAVYRQPTAPIKPGVVDTNPYQSPQIYPPVKPTNSTFVGGGILWLLFSFQGRIPRRTYWGVSLLATLVFYGVVLSVAKFMPAPGQPTGTSSVAFDFVALLVVLLAYPAMIWISLAIGAKRWHDLDMSAWWLLLNFVPFIGPLVTLVLCGFIRGTFGPNRFGADCDADVKQTPTDLRKNLISLTAGAVAEIEQRMRNGGHSEGTALRVTPNGLPFVSIEFDIPISDGRDWLGEFKGLPILIDKKDESALAGCQLDYDLESGNFVTHPPSIKVG